MTAGWLRTGIGTQGHWDMPQLLSTVPLWLTGAAAVPLDLEKSYEETCRLLRIA
jgi:hypothetical protein